MSIKGTASIILFVSMIFSARSQCVPEIGICGDFRQDSLFNASGYTAVVESIAKLVSPRNVDDQLFSDNLRPSLK
jgi:hypothetical protein